MTTLTEDNAILAMDIGGGTQDILIYQPDEPMENAVKMILPSPTIIAARRIGRVTAAKKPLFLSGRVMGGGAVSKAVRRHLAAGWPVYSLKEPALTLHDDLDKVRALGVQIVDEGPQDDSVEVRLGDLDLDALGQALAVFEVEPPHNLALAIQDHGFSPHASNRLNRFAQWQRFLSSGGDVGDLIFTEPPEELTRWVAALTMVPRAFFMDTSAAALRGALLDEYAARHLSRGLIMVNVGNEHTVAFLVKGRRVYGVYEHHTSLLDHVLLAGQLERFGGGNLTHKEIFTAFGHGVAYQPGAEALAPWEPMVVTGPRRELAKGLGHMAAPYGEMMFSGCFGLIQAVLELLPKGETTWA
ncbi:MAG: DUF1786 domain-containing protein [Pseudomonadota bacterium]